MIGARTSKAAQEIAIRPLTWALVLAGGSAACGGAEDEGGVDGRVLTYHEDVRPIVEAKCTQCHTEGGIAPFALTSAEAVVERSSAIVAATGARVMPPWPPASDCSQYQGDRSLSDEQIATLRRWANGGSRVGDAADFLPLREAPLSLSRVDRRLSLPEPYTPTLSPDEYRCFLLDWPASADEFITGFRIVPGDAAIVHHVILFGVAPADVDAYQAYDDAEPGQGYTCFGGPSGTGAEASSAPNMIGGWAPGSLGNDFPAGTGIGMPVGSKIVAQVHYNTINSSPAPDQTSVELKVDPNVDKPAYVLPFTNPTWIDDRTMSIPAGDADVMHSFSFNAGVVAAYGSSAAMRPTRPFSVYSVALHMHLLGTQTRLSLDRAGGEDACLLDIPDWDFHWQGSYLFETPTRVEPSDTLNIECHWDNSGGRHVEHGAPAVPQDTNWGEGTTDEMCIGFLYATE
jgi:hypothetical protein